MPDSSKKESLEALRQKIAELVARDPRKAALILTDWLKQSASQNPTTTTKTNHPRRKAG